MLSGFWVYAAHLGMVLTIFVMTRDMFLPNSVMAGVEICFSHIL